MSLQLSEPGKRGSRRWLLQWTLWFCLLSGQALLLATAGADAESLSGRGEVAEAVSKNASVPFIIPAWSYQPSSSSEQLQSGGVAESRKRNAYVTMMYCGTPKDYEFYTATRVLFKGLLRMQPDADLVVMVSIGCPTTWFEEYASDGFRVVLVDDIPNPYKDQAKFERRFLSSLNKLYAWTLTDYDRVVMLDADNIFIQNADELFQCGQFCAVFIDPCLFHTGLFVVEPSNETFYKMVADVGRIKSRDGGDQGFLLSYFDNLLDQPLFRPPVNGSKLNGIYRLPFGYQMDTSYYYWRLKWRVPCGPNAVMTFPGMPMLKPWFWYTWPILPLGITWHEQRRLSIGYVQELPIVVMQALVYLTILFMALSLRCRFCMTEKVTSFRLCASRIPDCLPYPFCHPWAIKGFAAAYMVLALLLPLALVPTTAHPAMGWSLYFFGSFSLLFLLGSFLQLPLATLLTPWVILVIMWTSTLSVLYSHGLPRLLTVGFMSTILSPFLLGSFKETIYFLDNAIDREPLMPRFYPRK